MRKPILYGLIIGIFVTILTVVVISIVVPGHFVYIGSATPVVTPIATPMPVIFRMRDADGKNEQEWLCNFERQEGWVCQVLEEEPDGETLDE